MGQTDVANELLRLSSPEKAASSARFFKTGPGQYGEGDVFIGVTLPDQRKVARQFKDLDLPDIEKLLHSDTHEHRLTALLILVGQYKKGDAEKRKLIYDFYLKNTRWINNWDLVDSSATYIVGPQVEGKDDAVLYKLARSSDVWERRIAMLACFYFIKKGENDLAFKIIEILRHDTHDLIHKAVGWMLREIGKKSGRQTLEDWLKRNANYKSLPRTALRYAIEHFEPEMRQKYLRG